MSDNAPPENELVELAQRLDRAARSSTVTVATAESCTGGLIGHVLTEIPGASDYYLGGAVSYSNDAKERLLGVPAETIARHGAVSAQVAVAMAEGARSAFSAAVAVSVTGIAGPAGGSDAKPVGLTYVAVADAAGHAVRRHVWTGDRSANKRLSASAALQLLVERLEGGAEEP
jgi:nicotinamide-nucleotide amidase